MTTEVDIGTLIERRPGVCGGRPVIAGTGVSVRRLAVMHNEGLSADEIVTQKCGLVSIAQVHAALAYYYANKTAVDADLQAEERQYDDLAKQYPRGA